MNYNILDKAEKYITEKKLNCYRAALYEDGRITCREFCKAARMNNVYSISKTFTATAIGMLVYRGKMNTKDLAAQYLAEYMPSEHAQNWSEITVENLLTHTWGQEKGDFFEAERYDYGGKDFLPEEEKSVYGADWLKVILSEKLPLRVGEDMRYSNASYYLLSRITEKITGKRLFDWLCEELFSRLNFHGCASGVCPQGHTVGATEMFFSAEDLLKLGILYLNKGVYGGKRYFAENWTDTAFTPRAQSNGLLYGYSFWSVNSQSSYCYSSGKHGQLLVVDRKKGIAFVLQSYDDLNDIEFLRDVFDGDGVFDK